MKSKTGMTEQELEHLVFELYWFIDFFNIVFFIGSPVSEPVFSFEINRRKSLGHLPVEGKSHGKDINIYRINPLHDLWRVLLIVLHLMVHTWQNQHNRSGKSWFHNKEFRRKMAECGIECNQNGCCTGIGDPFVFLLKKHGVIFGSKQHLKKIIRTKNGCKPNGNSNLKKWSCGCQNARVGKPEFHASCDICSNKFVLIA